MFSRWPRIWRRSEELECLCTPSSRCSTRPATWSRCTTGELDTQRINEKEETIANAAVVPHDSLEPSCWSCAPGATGLSTDIVQPTLFVRVRNVYLTCATLDRRSMARGTGATIPPPFATAVKSRVIYEAPRAEVPVPVLYVFEHFNLLIETQSAQQSPAPKPLAPPLLVRASCCHLRRKHRRPIMITPFQRVPAPGGQVQAPALA